MARASNSVSQVSLAEFKAALRELRQRAGDPTYRTMSRRTGVSAATLHGVDVGRSVPSLAATIAYVFACDGDRELWGEQHHVLLRGRRPLRKPFVPWRDYFDGERIAPPPTASALRSEMRRLRVGSGLTLCEIAEKTKEPRIAAIVGEWGLGVTTISDLCNPKQTRVPRRRTLHGFLMAIDAEPVTIERWLTVRNQLEARRDPQMSDLPAGIPAQRPAVTAPDAGVGILGEVLADGRVQVPDREFKLARFRRLRNDLAQGTPSSPNRIRSVLVSIGVDQGAASQMAFHQETASRAVFAIDRDMQKIMAEGRLPSSGAALALELAVRRAAISTKRAAQFELETEFIEARSREQEATQRRIRAEFNVDRARDQEADARTAAVLATFDAGEASVRLTRARALADDRSERAARYETVAAGKTAEAWAEAVRAHEIWARVAQDRADQTRTARSRMIDYREAADHQVVRARAAETDAAAETRRLRARLDYARTDLRADQGV
jgi:hypothetical protein